jgi:hypothetical protein
MAMALVVGEFLMIAVVKLSEWLVSPLLFAWLLSTIAVAIGGYVIFGLPILRVYADTSASKTSQPDFRGIWAERILRNGSHLAYVGGSVIGGAPGVAWYYGSRGDSRASHRTMGAAAIMAAFWCAAYLGLLTWIFG